MELSNQILAGHYADAYHRGDCESVNYACEGRSESGCSIRIELSIVDEKVVEAWFEADGCPVCESLTSLLVESIEGMTTDAAKALTVQQLLAKAGAEGHDAVEQAPCTGLPVQTLASAIETPIDSLDDDLADGTSFGGPSLREEC